jgi:hypothetical protein
MEAVRLNTGPDRDGNTLEYLNIDSPRRLNQEIKRVNVDFPVWMIESLDAEAARLGVSRQSVIKVWIADALERRGLHTSP